MLDEHVLAAAVARELAVQLRHGDVALVDDEQIVVGEVVEQRERRLAVVAAVDVHRVVLDAVAVPDLAHHLEVVLRAHPQALRFEQLVVVLEPLQPLLEFDFDLGHRLGHTLGTGDVVGGREDVCALQFAQLLAGQRVDRGDAVDRVAEHLDAQHRRLVGRMHLDGVATHPEVAAAERHVVAVVLHVDETTQDVAHVVVDADVEVEQIAPVLLGIAHAVDARHRRDHDHVAPGEQRGGRRVAQPVDLVVDRGVLLDVGVARRDVRLGLVVVVVADEVLDPVVGEELAHLLCELRGERLVRREDQRRPLCLLDGPGDRCRLARTGDAEQGLEALPGIDTGGEGLDRRRLVAGRSEIGHHPEHLVVRGAVVAEWRRRDQFGLGRGHARSWRHPMSAWVSVSTWMSAQGPPCRSCPRSYRRGVTARTCVREMPNHLPPRRLRCRP